MTLCVSCNLLLLIKTLQTLLQPYSDSTEPNKNEQKWAAMDKQTCTHFVARVSQADTQLNNNKNNNDDDWVSYKRKTRPRPNSFFFRLIQNRWLIWACSLALPNKLWIFDVFTSQFFIFFSIFLFVSVDRVSGLSYTHCADFNLDTMINLCEIDGQTGLVWRTSVSPQLTFFSSLTARALYSRSSAIILLFIIFKCKFLAVHREDDQQ